MTVSTLTCRHGLRLGTALLSVLVLSQCAFNEYGELELLRPEPKPAPPTELVSNRSKTHFVYVNEAILNSMNPDTARIEIDLKKQRARLYDQNELVIETQISTGKQGHNTPPGQYSILEKTIDKKSNLYGKWVDAESGETIESDGDSRNIPDHPNPQFLGTPMPYWMRITPTGVGMHIGYVPNYPASHGCIRVPKVIQPTFFSKIEVGTPVTIVDGSVHTAKASDKPAEKKGEQPAIAPEQTEKKTVKLEASNQRFFRFGTPSI